MWIKKISYNPLNQEKKKKFIKSNLTILLIYFFGTISYLLSLHEITGPHMACYKRKRIKCIYFLVELTFISSLLISISIYMILFKNYKKIHLFIIFFIYFIFYLLDHNNKVIKHGLFNFLGFLLSTLVLILIFCLAKIFFFFIKKRKYFIIILILMLFGYFFFYFKKYKLKHFFCDNWAFGFNNTFIDNTSKDYPCQIFIPQPHSCYLSEIGPYFDFTRIYKPTCLDDKLIKNEKKKFLKDINSLKYLKKSNKNHFGYPLTNNEEFKHDLFGTIVSPGNKSFEDEINRKIILMDLYNKNKEKYYPNRACPEIEID